MFVSWSSASNRSVHIVFALSLLVLSSPVMIFINPQLIYAADPITPTTTDTSNYHSTLAQPNSTISSPTNTVETPSTQAALQIPRTLQSTDLVNSLGFYEVTFITSTTGAIDKIRMDFPAGTNIAAAGVIERVGIGGGTLLKSGSSIAYDVTTPVTVPANTFIRLEMFGIKNPGNPSNTFTATITTRDSAGTLIDGPSVTNVYTIKQVGTNDIADSSITSTKPAEAFMRRVTLLDDPAGNDLGWNPNGVTTDFTITEILFLDESLISINLENADNVCSVDDYFVLGPPTRFSIKCVTAPPAGAELHYLLINLSSNLAS
jgi:hypothetical protein